MILKFISITGYGPFVWWSFSLTLLACIILYYKTFKTLKKYEKEFAEEIQELSLEKRRVILENSKVASQVLSSYNKTI